LNKRIHNTWQPYLQPKSKKARIHPTWPYIFILSLENILAIRHSLPSIYVVVIYISSPSKIYERIHNNRKQNVDSKYYFHTTKSSYCTTNIRKKKKEIIITINNIKKERKIKQ